MAIDWVKYGIVFDIGGYWILRTGDLWTVRTDEGYDVLHEGLVARFDSKEAALELVLELLAKKGLAPK